MDAYNGKKDPTFKKVMETQKERKDSEGYDWLESTELAIDKRKFLLNRLYEKQPIPQDQDWACYECYRIFLNFFSFRTFASCFVSTKTVNNQILGVFY